MTLLGKFAIVTGASQGLGLAIAEHFVEQGASLMLCARDAAAIGRAGAELQSRAGEKQRVLSMACDVADTAAVDRLAAAALDAFGRIDILVNNAGIYGPMGGIDEIDWAEWVDAIRINLMGTVYPCRAVIPAMKAQRAGKIVNISGGGATTPLPGISAYAASKAAVVRFTETIALELKDHGIDANALAPGALATRMMDQLLEAGPAKVGAAFHERMAGLRSSGGTPLAVGARCAAWLASAASDGITGRLIAAQWDDYENLPSHASDLAAGDIYTLRRIVPKDRGKDWGDR